MKQQVNLFHPMFRRERHVLSAAALVQSAAVACVGLLLLYGFGAWKVHALQRDVTALAAHRDMAQDRLLDIEKRVPQRGKSRVLATELAAAGAQLTRHRKLVGALSERSVGNPVGFSGFFAGLARQRVDGLWLTALEISAGGARVAIGGSALDPALVPKLVQRLAGEPDYEGVSFASLSIGRPVEETRRVDFVLRTDVVTQAALQ